MENTPITSFLLEKYGFTKEKSACEQSRAIWSIQVSNNDSLYYDPSGEGWYISHFHNNNHFQNTFWNQPETFEDLDSLYFGLTKERLKPQNS